MKINIEAQCLCVKREEIRGIPYYTLELLRHLVARRVHDYSISFLDYRRERNNRVFINDYCKDFLGELKIFECNDLSYLTIIDSLRKNDHSEYIGRAYEDYMKTNADIYHFPHSVQFPANAPAGKTVMTVHDIIPIVDAHTKVAKPDFCARFANAIKLLEERTDILLIADSINTKRDLVSYTKIKEDRITVIPIAYNKDFYYAEKKEDVLKKYGINRPYLLFLSALDPRKGIDVLVESLNYLHLQDIQVVLAGARMEEYDIDTIIEESPFKNNIVLTGYVTDDEKRALLSQAEIFVFPSYYEGFGLPVLEAMACGSPVITTNASSLPEVGGDAVVYIEPGNAEQLANEIESLLLDEERRKVLSKMGYNQAALFSWDKTAQLTENVYEQYRT